MISTPLDPAVAKVEIAAVGKGGFLLPYKDPEQARAYQAAYYAAHREQWQVYDAARHISHREELRVYHAAWRAAHRDEKRAYEAAYRARHPEKERARHRAYDASHPAKKRERVQRRRVRIRGQFVAPVDAQAIYVRDGGHCHICGKRVKPAEASMDHLVPISLGGVHAPHNVRLAHLKCNLRRNKWGPAQLLLPI